MLQGIPLGSRHSSDPVGGKDGHTSRMKGRCQGGYMHGCHDLPSIPVNVEYCETRIAIERVWKAVSCRTKSFFLDTEDELVT